MITAAGREFRMGDRTGRPARDDRRRARNPGRRELAGGASGGGEGGRDEC